MTVQTRPCRPPKNEDADIRCRDRVGRVRAGPKEMFDRFPVPDDQPRRGRIMDNPRLRRVSAAVWGQFV